MIIDKKCTCGSKSTGNTTIRCCNLCGLPLPNEPWHFSLDENIFSRVEKPVKPANGDTIKIINEFFDDYLLDKDNCFYIDSLKFKNNISFAALILLQAKIDLLSRLSV